MASLRLQGVRVLQLAPIELEIAAGSLVMLSGASGAGKSLLLRALADLDPHSGEVYLGTEPRSRMPASSWRRRVALLPAESSWWAETVGDHFPQNCHELTPWFERLGWSLTVLQWAVARLSTGERQRLALLRALALQPEALLLDEPTAHLDAANGSQVEALIADYRQRHQTAVLWVSHDAKQRHRLGDQSFCISQGQLIPEFIHR